MTALTSLPTEIMCQIAEHVDGQDLMKMRLVCKSLHSAANKPFGITYFTIRRHVLSMESIEALLEIVSHPGLGPYVCSIAMTAMYPLPPGPRSPYHQEWEIADDCLSHAFVNSRSYTRLMKQVFDKLSKLQTSVHIEICDTQSGFGWNEMMDHPPLRFRRCHVETLDQTLLAAIRANCQIRSLELEMYQYSFEVLHDALEDLLNPSRLPPLRLTIHCDRKRNRNLHSPYTIVYDQAEKSLKLDGCDVYELDMAKEGTCIKLLFPFLLSQTTKLIFENCHLCSDQRFRAFLALGGEILHNNLTSIRMQNFRPCRSIKADARRHCSGILRSLSKLDGLKHFVIEGLPGPSHWVLFHLPGNTEKYEVSGEDVAEQLEVMASLVATEPTHKKSSHTASHSDTYQRT